MFTADIITVIYIRRQVDISTIGLQKCLHFFFKLCEGWSALWVWMPTAQHYLVSGQSKEADNEFARMVTVFFTSNEGFRQDREYFSMTFFSY